MGEPRGTGEPAAPMRARLVAIATEALAGTTVAFVSLPISLAAGILIYTPLGVGFLGLGAAVGVYGAIIGGFVAAVVAPSSFTIRTPGTSVSLVLPSTVAAVAAASESPELAILAVIACVLLGGLLQAFAGAIGLGSIVRYTPHPVLAGFLSGIGLLILAGQFKFIFEQLDPELGFRTAALPLFVALQLALLLYLRRRAARFPQPFVVLVAGTATYHLAIALWPEIPLGGVLGALPSLDLPALTASPAMFGALAPYWQMIVLAAATLAIVSSFESLLTNRQIQRMGDVSLSVQRDLCAVGAGNCAAALAGGAPVTGSTSQSILNFRLGGRTRVSVLTASIVLLALATVAADLLSMIPVAAVSALLLGVAIQVLDNNSAKLILDAVRAFRMKRDACGRDLMNAAVIVLVAASVGSGHVVLGTIFGVILAAVIFISQMSRPAIRRVLRVPEALSRRARPRADMDWLEDHGGEIAVVELEGALFFGNAEDLAGGIKTRARGARFVVLDFADVTDIDLSGTSVLCELVDRAKRMGVLILLCNIGQRCHVAAVDLSRLGAKIFSDRDMALEWAEDRLLAGHSDCQAAAEVPLDRHELLAGLSPAEIALVASSLRRLEFQAGAVVCSEGENADRMWMIVAGSVSIRVRCDAPGETRRIASRTAGTMIGEMALLEGGPRSATIVADVPVIAYELSGGQFVELLAVAPNIANRILLNIAAELAGRLRIAAGALRSIRS